MIKVGLTASSSTTVKLYGVGGGKDRIQLGSSASGRKVVNRSGDAFLNQHGDLMAIVEDAAGDLQRRGSYLV